MAAEAAGAAAAGAERDMTDGGHGYDITKSQREISILFDLVLE